MAAAHHASRMSGEPSPDPSSWTRARRRPGLRSRLTLAFALSSGLPLLVIMPVAWTFAGRTYEERMRAETQAARDHAQEQVHSLGQATRTNLERFTNDERVRELLGDPTLLLRVMKSEEPFRRYDLDAVFFLTVDGEYLVNSLAYGNTFEASAGARRDFERALDPQASIRRLEVNRDGQQTVFALAARDVGSVRVVGARALDARFLEELSQSYPMTYVISTSARPPFSGPHRPDDAPPPATEEELRRGYFEAVVPIELDGESRQLIILRSKAELFATRTRLTILAVSLFGLALGLSGLTGYVLSQRIARPVDLLVSGLAEVAGGNLEVRMDERAGPDEIMRMAEAFNRMTTDLRDNKQKLLRAERIAAWEEIARRLAHEIKNPLSPIRLAIENCRKAYDRRLPEFDEIFTEATQAVLEEVDKLRRIVEEFSLFARMPKPILTLQDVNEVVHGVVKLHASGAAIRIDLDDSIPPFLFDADQIHRVVVNLVQNAIDVSPPGEEVRVSTRRVAEPEPEVRIAVRDRGPGIRPEHQQQLFTPYFTTKTHGTGLGLAISARIVEEHGGGIVVEATDSGATFTVTLPLMT